MWQVEGVRHEGDRSTFLPLGAEDVGKTHDTKLVFALLDWMKERYNIDEGRRYTPENI